ncbi:TVP38/TMEM64 family protein [Desulfonatronovibrio hydrogenovorans]|uniref:TVP38/TMEM64 family protein n=1 Tax=Desulfonatronovibrio hydrogenovorans TaxID=53245 RepID=UPI001FC95B47|nr:VTT domain-containing protein [Desulfonatronovibrio hydrogenovorans]
MKANVKLIALAAVLGAGIYAQHAGLLDLSHRLDQLENLAESWWAPLVAVIAQIILYMFAFPGSVLMWTIGVLYPPWAAAGLVVAGGVLGSLSAYFFAVRMSYSWNKKLVDSKIYGLIRNNSGFLQLCALRCLPGFPHSFINYSAGILRIRLVPFIISTSIGFAVKGFIYCSAIYAAFHLEEGEPAVSFSNLWPLMVLVLFSLLGILIQKKYFSGHDKHK